MSAAWSTAPRRPRTLVLICALMGFLDVSALVLGATGSAARAMGPVFWPYLLATAGGGLVSVVGLWRGRRWGLWGLAVSQMLDQGVTAAAGDWHWPLAALTSACVLGAWTQRRALH